MNRSIKQAILYILVIQICICCTRDPLQKAFCESGDNRCELEKVIAHYSTAPADSIKLRAARFLISNMPGHYGIHNREHLVRITAADSFGSNSYFAKKALELSLSYFIDTKEKSEDLTTLSAEFLISHIDQAFSLMDKCPWLRNINTDIFFEYLLPYRFLFECPDHWRDSLPVSSRMLSEVQNIDDVKYLTSQIVAHLQTGADYRALDEATSWALFGVPSAVNCYFSTVNNLLKYRSQGIPSAIDFIPYYANRNGFHYWVSVIAPEKKFPNKGFNPERKAPKIYRCVYSMSNPFAADRDEYMPELFRNPFIKDVTAEYQYTSNAVVWISQRLNIKRTQYGFLAVFNGSEWRPVAIGTRNSRTFDFEDLGTGVVYLPVYYDDNVMKAVNYPFILWSNGKIEYLVPDTIHTSTLTLKRKYHSSLKLKQFYRPIIGAQIVASNDMGFHKSTTIASLTDQGETYFDEKCSGEEAFRYLKFIPRRKYYSISELFIYNHTRRIIPARFDSFFEKAFDGDPLTSVNNSDAVQREMIVDLGKPTLISRIVCLPRGDGNDIYPGKTYELYYLEPDGWHSLGIQTASDHYLKYEGVPSGALYWLRCLDEGVEERIFTCDSGKVHFW